MKLTRQLTALALCAVLSLSPVLASGENGTEKFPSVNTFTGYWDVKTGDWFYSNAKICYEIGLMKGTNIGFEPNATLRIAEVATIAARMRETLTGETISAPVPDPGRPWYQHYIDYLASHGVSVGDPEKDATRLEFVKLLSAVLPDGVLTSINDITSLPDTSDPDILAFYQSGILTGVDKYGTFLGERTLNRAECSAMISRIARPELQMKFIPAKQETVEETPSMQTMLKAASLPAGTAMFSNGIAAEQFLTQVNCQIADWETSLRQNGSDFNWQIQSGDGKTVLEHIKEETLSKLGVTADQGTQSYKDFDYQVYYARLIQMTGKLLGWDEVSMISSRPVMITTNNLI